MSIPDHARGYENFEGSIGRTIGHSRPAWPTERGAPAGAPNIIVVLVDDMGYSDIGPYGSETDTPNLARLAGHGVQCTNYHTTPLCSPSRAALLTGLNPHRAGFAYPANLDPGYPSYAFELPQAAPTLAESLRHAGYATFAVGKWHLTRDAACHDAADRSSWPLQRGFDRYFGSLEGFTNLHAPHRLVWDNSPFEYDSYPDDYFLTDDLTDRAIGMIRTLRASDSSKPFFLYFAHHAVHGPIQAPAPDIAKYRGRYHTGWDQIRHERFDRQLRAGLFPPDTRLPRSNTEPNKDVRPWSDHTPEQRELFARYMEVYAAGVDNIDQNLGRLLGAVERHGELENTIVVFTSDNGASAEGGAGGTRSYFSAFAHVPGLPTDWVTDVPREPDLIGGPRSTVHYPRGWAQASNTPFRLYKSDTFAGGIRAPLIINWPQGLATGGLRHQYLYVTDLAPTLLELAGVERLSALAGAPAMPEDGLSAARILLEPHAPTVHTSQYTETGGNRGYFADGWKIVTNHLPGTDFDDAEWQLYHLDTDPTETTDLAAAEPERLKEMAAAWEHAAWQNTVFPLNDRSPALALRRPSDERWSRPLTLYPGTTTLERYRSAQLIHLRDVEIVISLEFTSGDRGVLVAHGDQGGGYAVWIDNDAVRLSYNAYGRLVRTDPLPLPAGQQSIRVNAQALTEFRWQLIMRTAEEEAALDPVPQLIAMAPFTGISIGLDAGGPVDWDLHEREGAFRYTGRLHSVHYQPGPRAAYDPGEVARIWAQANHIYD